MIVPNLPLKKINSDAPKVPSSSTMPTDSFNRFYQSLLGFHPDINLTKGHIKDSFDSIAENFLRISNSLLEMQNKHLSPTRGFYNKLYEIPTLKPAKQYLDALFTGYVPQLSEFHKYVESQTQHNISLKREDYLKPLTEITNKFADRMDKALFSISRNSVNLNKSISGLFFGKPSNENFYGDIPLGYTSTLNYGKLGWERIDWTQIDPIAAESGVVIYGGTTRPDMSLFKLELDKKNQIEPLTPLIIPNQRKHPPINRENPFSKDSSTKYGNAHFNNPKFNKTVQAMLQSGADFINNMFDVFILYRDKDDVLKTLDENLNDSFISKGIKFERILNGVASFNSIFMIRTSSIQVPQIKNETFDLKWIDHTVKKVRSKINYERKSELKILMDEPMYMNLLFNIFAGTGRAGSYQEDKKTRFHNTYSGSLVSFDIIIKHEALLNYPYLEAMKENWRLENKNILHAGLRSEEMPLWWFRDVRFLGESSNYTFNRESPSIIEATFPFTFSRCVRIDRSAKILIQNVLFNNSKDSTGKESSWMKEQTMGQGNQEWMLDTFFWKNWNGDFDPGTISYSGDAPKYDALPQTVGIVAKNINF